MSAWLATSPLSWADDLWSSLSPGARRSALANADTAIPANEDGVFHNPAALADIASRSVRAQSLVGFEEIRGTGLGLLWPSVRTGTWGIHLNKATAGTMEVLPLGGSPTGSLDAQTETVISGSWGGNVQRFSPRLPSLSLGVAARCFLSEVAESGTDVGQSVDLGAQWRFLKNRVSLGVAFQNGGGQIGSENLPRLWSAGAAYTFRGRNSHRGLVAVDLARLANGETSPRLGVEYEFRKLLIFRTGMAVRDTENQDRWAAGLGFRLPFASTRMDLDYAYRSAGALGGVHGMDLTWRWSPLAHRPLPSKEKSAPHRHTVGDRQ
ncbi:MAG: hypothetical protein JNK54_02955 [Elusimicrobia bacterium]|nr:hypothetical protein [Elusimicrobiota bacterium]